MIDDCAANAPYKIPCIHKFLRDIILLGAGYP